MSSDYYTLDPQFTDPKRLKKEREKAQKLKKTQWWLDQLQKGICHYCAKKFSAKELTMDHVVPLARGGTSAPGNIVPACRGCNRDKKLSTPVDDIFKQLEAERNRNSDSAPESSPNPSPNSLSKSSGEEGESST